MSRTTHRSPLRPFVGAGIIAAAGLAAPAAARAQTSAEGALLSRLAPTVYLAGAFARSSTAGLLVVPATVDGERALLARTPGIQVENRATTPRDAAPATVDGSYALLGASSPPAPRHPAIPAALR